MDNLMEPGGSSIGAAPVGKFMKLDWVMCRIYAELWLGFAQACLWKLARSRAFQRLRPGK
jgi:hypothetical protein